MESTANINDTNTDGVFNKKNVKIRYILNGITLTENLELYDDSKLEQAFEDYKRQKNINDMQNQQRQTVFHLIKENGKINLDKNKKIQELGLQEGDLIEITYQDSPNLHIPSNSTYNLVSSPQPNKKKKFIIISVIIVAIVIGLTVFLLLWLLFHNKNKKNEQNKSNSQNKENGDNQIPKDVSESEQNNKLKNSNKNYTKEKLISEKRPYYPNNTLFLYNSIKEMNVAIEGISENLTDAENMTKLREYMDFSLLIQEENEEIDEINEIKKIWYSGFISLYNITINDGTNDTTLLFNEEIYKYVDDKKSRIVEEESESKKIIKQPEPLFAKINFYENGEIKEISIPNEFNISNIFYIEKIIKFIIPKLSTHLYSKNFNEELELIEKLSNDTNYDEDEDEEELSSDDLYDEDNYEMDDSSDNYEENENALIQDKNSLLRKTSENVTNISRMFDENEKAEPEIDYASPSDSSSNENNKYQIKGISENKTVINITDFEQENIEGMQAKLEGSQIRKIKNSFLDSKGMLYYIIENENISISQPPIESISDLSEEEDKLKSEIYNDNNEIPRNEDEDFIGNNCSFASNIKSIKLQNKNNISFVKKVDNTENIQNLYDFYNKFSYTKYKNDLNLRFLKYKNELEDDYIKKRNDSDSELNVEHTKLPKKNNKRKLQSNGDYYGIKNFEKEKVIFKYNLIGLILEGTIVTKIDVSTGRNENYFKLTLGFINLNFKLSSVQTNLHILIKNSHEMTYNMMHSLYQSNEELVKRNQIYSDIILNLEKNVSKILEEHYDFSNLFRTSLENLYEQVKNFSGQIFNELIELIENVYDNYTIILNQVENDEFEILNNITLVTKNEYINYINAMFETIIVFKNDTLIFLNYVNHEVDIIQTFQLDVLYDIIDAIDDGKKVFTEFFKKLFKAVDRGITTFKYDLRDFIEEIIGDLLYLTDFLSININKNEILKNAIDPETRQRVTIKLKNFRNIILRIMEILNSNIIKDYEEEMSIDNKNSIKYNKEYIIQNCIIEINNKSDEVINYIKSKINYINLYENYANNIGIINEINNKTYIEFNNDMYYNILRDITKIKPEYLDKNSDLIKNKNYLFSLSNNITDIVNSEIIEINKYIDLYSENYINNHNNFLDYNLYYFRNYFSNKFLNSLYNEYKKIIKDALEIHFIDLIKKNYELAFEYMQEVKSIISKSPSYRILGTVFINSYTKYKTTFQEMAYFCSKEEFLSYIENNFNNVTIYILNYINKKIKSINKYYFNEIKRDTFYKLDLIEQEIYRISDNINNYFNEMKLDSDIKTMILNIALKDIPEFNDVNMKKLDDLYDTIYKKAQKEKIHSSSCDVIKLRIKKKRKWYWPFKVRIYYYYDCYKKAKSKKNIDKIIKDLSVTKKYLDEKFNDFITNYIKKFDTYLNNTILHSHNLYYNLYTYTQKKINNDENIKIILNEYKNIFNNIVVNNIGEKIYEKINSNNLFNGVKLSDILINLENNLFEIDNIYYQNHYMIEKNDFLEYPDEIILKLNQSAKKIKSNIDIIKNKINLSLMERIKNILKSTKLFIDNNNKFNFEYIFNKINREDIYNAYISHKFNFLNNSYNSISKLNKIENNNLDYSILTEENYGNITHKLSNNYTNYIFNLTKEIDDNFTYYICPDFSASDSDQLTDQINIDSSSIEPCIKERFSTKLNYSKYNFNVVKFRTEVSNSRKFPELFNSLFDDINYNNILESKEIIEIDDIINNKNFLFIYNKTKNKSKKIEDEFLSMINETFEDFGNKFLFNTKELTNNFWEFMDSYKVILNNKNTMYNNNISEINNNILESINNSLANFNSTLYDSLSVINISEYDYYSIEYDKYKKYFDDSFSLLEDSFNTYIKKIKGLKDNNLFYSIPKLYLNDIFREKRKIIEAIISEYSNNYDFDSIGFKYNLSNYFDSYLKKYYIYYELNNSYDYFELIQNNKDIYIENILKQISDIKKIANNKYNIIVEEFMKYSKSGSNYVEKNYINNIKLNISKCLKTLSNFKITIKNYLNDTNITETDDYIINNCTSEEIIEALINNSESNFCLNVSEINISLYYKELNKISECQSNNYYNYTYIIYEGFKEDNKYNLDQNMFNIIKTVNSNIIDENYLNQYVNNYFIKNTSLDINIIDYKNYFEDIQDFNLYIKNLREPEYQSLMKENLIESFNVSYTSIANLYLTNEIINKINNLLYNKFDIFIDYYMNKIRDDSEYFSFLLDSIEEIGNSSKSAIINLYSNIPKKLNETIYYIIEDDIFYYIDIFFRENKNIFINNYLKFYLNDINKYNVPIYKIEDYVNEMISIQVFNQSLNNISLYLINKIKKDTKNNIKNSIFTKLDNFININNEIKDDIQIKLNLINTSVLPDDMTNLVLLINNYNFLVNSQSNRYNFIVGESPYILLNIFINETLQPPLTLILNKYNEIENDLLNQIESIAKNFPDCVTDVKNNLIGNKFDRINESTNSINETILDYENYYLEDIESYINKLIPFIYIDGLKTMGSSCKKFDCIIKKNSLRNLKENSLLLNMRKTEERFNHLINITSIENNINKNINFKEKRKTSSLMEYSPKMGALSEKDVLYYLSDLQNTTLKFNKTYFGKEYYNVNITTNKFISKHNIYLEKMRLSFDTKLVKFSTILTAKSMINLKNIIMKQFYVIEEYINNCSKILQNEINIFIENINSTSPYIEKLTEFIYAKVMGYYQILYNSIQSKYRMINSKRNLASISAEFELNDPEAVKAINEMKNSFNTVLGAMDAIMNGNLGKFILDEILDNIKEKISEAFSKELLNYEKGVSYEEQISFPFPAIPFLEIVIKFRAYAGMGVYLAFKTSITDSIEALLTFNSYAMAGVEMYVEGGFYIPSSQSPIQINFVVGLGGIIGEGRAGINLEFSIIKRSIDLDVYFILNAFQFQFYFRLGVYINIPLFSFNMEFYIFRVEFDGIQVRLNLPKKIKF